MKQSMFYGAPASIFKKAAMLRGNPTSAEVKLWQRLKGNQVLGLRFKAQHPIDLYIADFYCHHAKVVIEIDGLNHGNKIQKFDDEIRTINLNDLGIEVIRFTNDEVNTSIESVIAKIVNVVSKRIT